jgi:hypothetical protein
MAALLLVLPLIADSHAVTNVSALCQNLSGHWLAFEQPRLMEQVSPSEMLIR